MKLFFTLEFATNTSHSEITFSNNNLFSKMTFLYALLPDYQLPCLFVSLVKGGLQMTLHEDTKT